MASLTIRDDMIPSLAGKTAIITGKIDHLNGGNLRKIL